MNIELEIMARTFCYTGCCPVLRVGSYSGELSKIELMKGRVNYMAAISIDSFNSQDESVSLNSFLVINFKGDTALKGDTIDIEEVKINGFALPVFSEGVSLGQGDTCLIKATPSAQNYFENDIPFGDFNIGDISYEIVQPDSDYIYTSDMLKYFLSGE